MKSESTPSENRKRLLHRLLLVVPYAAALVLIWVPRSDLIVGLLLRFAVGAAILLLIPGRYIGISLSPRPKWWQLLAMLCWSALFFFSFRSSWIALRRLGPVIARLGRWWKPLLTAVDLAGVAFSLPLQWKLLHAYRSLNERIRAAALAGDERLGPVPMRRMRYLLLAALFLLQFYMMQYSILSSPSLFFTLTPYYYFLNIAFFVAVGLALAIFLQRWRRALTVSCVFFTVWALANHYVFLFHASPLYFSELANAATAMNVLPNYRFTLAQAPWSVLGTCVLMFTALRTFSTVEKRYPVGGWRPTMLRALLAVLLALPIYHTLLSSGAKSISGSTPTFYISRYGFVCTALSNVRQTLDPYVVPEGFSTEALPAAQPVSADTDCVKPDIILIVNESFCDLDDYMTLNADWDYMAPFYGLDGARYGHAVTPSVGGGTNNTEYELLTGFPYYLVTAYAPFNYLNFNRIDCTVPRYLGALGYTSLAMHFYSDTNYHRSITYPAMGFDDTLLGPTEDLSDAGNGRRGHLDSSYYAVMNRVYASQAEDGPPRLYYLLTFQNHGGYYQNPAELDTVHAAADTDADMADQLNEYLSSVALSARAFADLTAFYSRTDRSVVICMVGDHAPSFIQELSSDRGFSSQQLQIARRTVPYVLWSNCGIDFSGCPDQINVFGLVPQILYAAGLPITQYYRSILDMERAFPVLLNNGLTMDSEGQTVYYDVSDPRFASVKNYLYLSYAGLRAPAGYSEAMVLPQ